MNFIMLENWVLSLSRYKRLALKITDRLIARVNLEPIEDENGIAGVKATWVGERGESVLEINTQSWKGKIKTEGDSAPALEYWQKGDRRGFALRKPKGISCEVDEKTLRKIVTPKAAGIAAAAGAAVGLLGWSAAALASRVAIIKRETENPSPPLLESETTSADSSSDEPT